MANHFKIIYDKDSTYQLCMNGVNIQKQMPLSQQYILLEKANQVFDKEILEVANETKNEDDGIFLWSVTYLDFRMDALAGTVMLYFILQVMDDISAGAEKITIDTYIPQAFIDCLKKNGYTIILTGKYYVEQKKHWVKEVIGPILPIVKCRIRRIVEKKKYTEIDANKPVIALQKSSRYRGLLEKLPQDNIIVYNTWLTCYSKESFDFSRYFRLDDVFWSIKEGFKFKKKYKTKLLEKYKNNFFLNLSMSQSLLQFASVRWRYTIFERFIISNNIKLLIVTQTLNDRISRLQSTIAHRHQIKVLCNTCRPMLTRLRTEDRLFEADKKQYGNSKIADHFLVIDKYSKDTLLSYGIDSKNIISCNQSKSTDIEKKKISNGFLMLFEAPRNMNDTLVEILCSLKDVLNHSNIYYRTHPNSQLSKKHQIKLNTLFGERLIDITAYSWRSLIFENIISFNGVSTAGIESVSAGAGLIWLPFLSNFSLTFGDVMSKIGIIAESESKLKSLILDLQNEDHRRIFIKECQENYLLHFKDNHSLSIEEVADCIIKLLYGTKFDKKES
jgi:hypothetical protein